MIRPMLCLLASLALPTIPTFAQDTDLQKQAMKLHVTAGGTYCERMEGAYVPENDYEQWTFDYLPSWSSSEDERQSVTLIRIFCASGAYNVSDAYYWYRDYEGLQPLAFAMPSFKAEYEGESDDTLRSLTVTGFEATTLLVNSAFDPETLTVISDSKWRGLGDASSSGTWVFDDGAFVLKRFDIDASYDNAVNPETVVDYPTAP